MGRVASRGDRGGVKQTEIAAAQELPTERAMTNGEEDNHSSGRQEVALGEYSARLQQSEVVLSKNQGGGDELKDITGPIPGAQDRLGSTPGGAKNAEALGGAAESPEPHSVLKPTIDNPNIGGPRRQAEADELLINPLTFGYDPATDQLGQAQIDRQNQLNYQHALLAQAEAQR